jgi:hypothetical protein
MLSVREICTSFQEIFADVVIKDGGRQGSRRLLGALLILPLWMESKKGRVSGRWRDDQG